jgi:hypothetical protein
MNEKWRGWFGLLGQKKRKEKNDFDDDNFGFW